MKQRKWDGEIVAASSEEAHLQLKTKSTADLAMAIRLPMAVASRTCQHTLYDPNTCRASRGNGNYVVHTTVANVVGDVVTLASIGGRRISGRSSARSCDRATYELAMSTRRSAPW